MSVTLHTSLGDLKVEVYCELVPRTAENFLALCASGKYDKTLFHRVIKGFMIQGGDPTGTGRGGESYWGGKFADELHPELRHAGAGVLSMANAGPDSNGSQFLITLAPTPHLDGKHQIFGRVIKGEEVVLGFQQIELSGEKPVDDLVIVNCGQMVR